MGRRHSRSVSAASHYRQPRNHGNGRFGYTENAVKAKPNDLAKRARTYISTASVFAESPPAWE